MPKALKTTEEKAVFRYRRDQARNRLPRYAALLLAARRTDFTAERIYNVLRSPIRSYDDEVLTELEKMAQTTPV